MTNHRTIEIRKVSKDWESEEEKPTHYQAFEQSGGPISPIKEKPELLAYFLADNDISDENHTPTYNYWIARIRETDPSLIMVDGGPVHSRLLTGFHDK